MQKTKKVLLTALSCVLMCILALACVFMSLPQRRASAADGCTSQGSVTLISDWSGLHRSVDRGETLTEDMFEFSTEPSCKTVYEVSQGVRDVAAGEETVFVVDSDGTLFCMGRHSEGYESYEPGDFNFNFLSCYSGYDGVMDNVVAVATDSESTYALALDEDGASTAWGMWRKSTKILVIAPVILSPSARWKSSQMAIRLQKSLPSRLRQTPSSCWIATASFGAWAKDCLIPGSSVWIRCGGS